MQCVLRKKKCDILNSPKLKILGKGGFGEISKIEFKNNFYAAKNSFSLEDGLLDVSVGVLIKHKNVLDIENVRTQYDCENLKGLFFTSGVYIGAEKMLGKIDPNKAMLDIISGLRALEKIDCYHFDLKIANLLYNTETEEILIADLGGCHFMLRQKYRTGVWVSSTQTHAPLTIYSSLKNFKIGHFHVVFALGMLAAEFVLGEYYNELILGHDRTIYTEVPLSESKNTKERLKFLNRALIKSNALCKTLIEQTIECLLDRFKVFTLPSLLSYLPSDTNETKYFIDLNCPVDKNRYIDWCSLISGLNLNITISMILCTATAVLVSKNCDDMTFYGYLHLAMCVMDLSKFDPDPDFKLNEAISILGGMLCPISIADMCQTKEEMYSKTVEFINDPKNITGAVYMNNWEEPFSIIVEPKKNKYILKYRK